MLSGILPFRSPRFLVGYVVSLVFETAALVRFVNEEKRRRQS